MNFKIKQNILNKHLNYVIKGISNKNLIPILNCIKLELNEEGLYLTSTNNDLAIKTFIEKSEIETITNPGIIVIPGKYFSEIIKKLPNEIITIEEVLEEKINIFTKNSSFYLNCNKTSDYPLIDLELSDNPITLNKTVFKNLINQTIFAVSTDEERPALTGLNIEINSNKLKCIGTDSYRLSSKEIDINSSLKNINIIIPSKNLHELIKIISENDELLKFHIFNNYVIFEFDTIIFMSRLINATFPTIPILDLENFKIKINVSKTDLYNSIDRASLLANEYEKDTINLKLENSEIIISSNVPEIGRVKEKIQINLKDHEKLFIAFSSKYMLEALRALDEEEVTVSFDGELKPIIIQNKNNTSLFQLILPIRTNI